MEFHFMQNAHNLPFEILVWIKQNIHRPIKGFEHKRNPDGTYYSPDQQLKATHRQAVTAASYFVHKGKSRPEIINFLIAFL
jgi:hypothetical protein